MLAGMTALKIAVSLPEPLVAHVRKQVRRGRAASVSAYVADALKQKAESDELATMLEEALSASGGPMTRTERAWADRALGVAPKRKR
jgi:Arc/MetJ-type ribon-helix-helix transcriptional regulator